MLEIAVHIENASFDSNSIVKKLGVDCLYEFPKEDWVIHNKSKSSKHYFNDMSPVLHTCNITEKHAGEVAELHLSDNLVRVLKATGACDDCIDMSRGVHSLLSTISSNRVNREGTAILREDKTENLVLSIVMILVPMDAVGQLMIMI